MTIREAVIQLGLIWVGARTTFTQSHILSYSSTLIEHHLAKISSAQHAFAVSSGMAALDVITRLLKPGDEVIAGDDLYGGTNRLLTYLNIILIEVICM